jgi:hypothetical protein
LCQKKAKYAKYLVRINLFQINGLESQARLRAMRVYRRDIFYIEKCGRKPIVYWGNAMFKKEWWNRHLVCSHL